MREHFRDEAARLSRQRDNAATALFLAGRAVVADHFGYEVLHLNLPMVRAEIRELHPATTQVKWGVDRGRQERARLFREGVIAISGYCAAESYRLGLGLKDGQSDAFGKALVLTSGKSKEARHCLDRMRWRSCMLTQKIYKSRVSAVALALLDHDYVGPEEFVAIRNSGIFEAAQPVTSQSRTNRSHSS